MELSISLKKKLFNGHSVCAKRLSRLLLIPTSVPQLWGRSICKQGKVMHCDECLTMCMV